MALSSLVQRTPEPVQSLPTDFVRPGLNQV